jgi:thymidine phosphorylase
MNQPLGNYIGNWLEVYESVMTLQGGLTEDLNEVTFNLIAAMLILGGKAKTIEEGIEIAKYEIRSGRAFDKFLEIVKLQKGDVAYLKNPAKYPKSKYKEKIYSEKTGYIKEIDNYSIGLAALELGAGRKTLADKIDPKAGIIFYPKIGKRIKKGELIAKIFTDKKSQIDAAKKMIYDSLKFTSKKVRPPKLIKSVINL